MGKRLINVDEGVNWSQLLEVGIDNADDLYWWYVTFSIDTTAI